MAGLFLLDWVHRRAVLDMDDAAMLPRVVRAWSAYALAAPRPAAAGGREQTTDAVEEMIPEFARLYATGERRSPATAAVAQLHLARASTRTTRTRSTRGSRRTVTAWTRLSPLPRDLGVVVALMPVP